MKIWLDVTNSIQQNQFYQKIKEGKSYNQISDTKKAIIKI